VGDFEKPLVTQCRIAFAHYRMQQPKRFSSQVGRAFIGGGSPRGSDDPPQLHRLRVIKLKGLLFLAPLRGDFVLVPLTFELNSRRSLGALILPNNCAFFRG
jgi:hypothetical protein